VQLQRAVFRGRLAHPAQVRLQCTLRPLDGGFPVDEFYNQKAVSFGKAPLAGHLEVRQGGVQGLEAARNGERRRGARFLLAAYLADCTPCLSTLQRCESSQADSAYNLTRARPVADFAAAAKYTDDVLEGLGEGRRAGVKNEARWLRVVGEGQDVAGKEAAEEGIGVGDSDGVVGC
jgi:hypothetical protein